MVVKKPASEMSVPELLTAFNAKFSFIKQGSLAVGDMRKLLDGELIIVMSGRRKYVLYTKSQHDEAEKNGLIKTKKFRF